MKVFITGATSGIGLGFARLFNEKKFELILMGNNDKRIDKLKLEFPSATVIKCDFSKLSEVKKAITKIKNESIDIVINNAGFGVHGEFSDTNVNKEIDMINVNVVALHYITKHFVKKFKKIDHGYILNVGSSAGFLTGPLMASYYASKSYVYRLTDAINFELRKSNVYVGLLAPGPVDTNFNKTAGVNFSIKPKTVEYVCKYTYEKMMKNKKIILPGFDIKLGYYFSKILPGFIVNRIIYRNQKNKML